MRTAQFFRIGWIILFAIFVIWGILPSDSGISPFEATAREYVRLHSDLEFHLLSSFIVPIFCFGFGWYSKEIFSDIANKLFK